MRTLLELYQLMWDNYSKKKYGLCHLTGILLRENIISVGEAKNLLDDITKCHPNASSGYVWDLTPQGEIHRKVWLRGRIIHFTKIKVLTEIRDIFLTKGRYRGVCELLEQQLWRSPYLMDILLWWMKQKPKWNTKFYWRRGFRRIAPNWGFWWTRDAKGTKASVEFLNHLIEELYEQ